jgi:hypothetical protein
MTDLEPFSIKTIPFSVSPGCVQSLFEDLIERLWLPVFDQFIANNA